MQKPHTRTLKINAPAKKIISDFKETLRLKINKEGNSRIQSMLGKYDILIYRFALILQVMYLFQTHHKIRIFN